MHQAIDKHFLHMLYSRFLLSRGVSTDSRTLQNGQIFFALAGTRRRGDDFVEEALSKDAICLVTARKYKGDDRFYTHRNPLLVLQALASFHRAQYRRNIIAITGTNGKTTTRCLVHAVLSKKYSTATAVKNFNNHIGVPLTLLSIHPQLAFLVIELASSAPGEIAFLCEMARPTHGLITNVGVAHLALLKSEKGVQREKQALYTFLTKNRGEIFLNTRQKTLKTLLPPDSVVHTYPSPEDDFPLVCRSVHPGVSVQIAERSAITSPLMGQHNFENIATAVAVGKYFDVSVQDIEDAIATYTPHNHRSQWIKTSTNTLLMDAYNANPSAVDAILRYWEEMEATRKVVILGEMKELGSASKTAHQRIGGRLHNMRLHKIFLCGQESRAAQTSCPEAVYFPSTAACAAYVRKNPLRGCHILLKGSRSNALEALIPHL